MSEVVTSEELIKRHKLTPKYVGQFTDGILLGYLVTGGTERRLKEAWEDWCRSRKMIRLTAKHTKSKSGVKTRVSWHLLYLGGLLAGEHLVNLETRLTSPCVKDLVVGCAHGQLNCPKDFHEYAIRCVLNAVKEHLEPLQSGWTLPVGNEEK